MKERKITLYCRKCGHKKTEIMDHFATDVDTRCSKCKTPMVRRIRINCFIEGCKRWVIVEGDPTFNNPNFYNKEKDQHIDIRNQGLICNDHEKEKEDDGDGEDDILTIPDKRINPKIDTYELKKPIDDMSALQVADAMSERLKQIEIAEGSKEKKQLFYATAKEIKVKKVSVNYINYQGSLRSLTYFVLDQPFHEHLRLDVAKCYLKFLLSIKTVNQFKTHWQFERERKKKK